MTTLDDESVAAYLRLSKEQVRILRQRPEHVTCDQCANVHPSYPLIRMFHSPCCAANGMCAMCGTSLGEQASKGHEVGLICGGCYGADTWD